MFKSFKPKIAIIGLWYVWLPLAHAFAKRGLSVTGFDINTERLKQLEDWYDITNEIIAPETKHLSKIKFSSNKEDLRDCNFFIVTVPTPIDQFKKPDLTPIHKASETVWSIIEKWSIVVYESTVYPWVTETICRPIIEKLSWLKLWKDFKLGYSPERINPWDREHTITKILKVVSWSDEEALNIVSNVYGKIITAWVFRASNIMVAEAAKVIENTQRDLNISLINELSIIFEKLWINTYDVLEAAGTKWNFLHFRPWLVWGHCIWVDPYYLVQIAEELGHHPEVITAWRKINDEMSIYVANQLIKQLIEAWKDVKWAKILVMWLTFKSNVPDFRNSKVADLIKELKSFWLKIKAFDPYSNNLSTMNLEAFSLRKSDLINTMWWEYDGIVYAVQHKEFKKFNVSHYINWSGVIYDLTGSLRDEGYENYKCL